MRAWFRKLLGLVPEPERCLFCGRLKSECPFKRRVDDTARS